MRTMPNMITVPKGRKPLTAAHVGLLKLLARVAVEDFVREEQEPIAESEEMHGAHKAVAS